MCDHCSDILTDLLPGKVTTVLKRTEMLNPKLNPSNTLVGVRIPDHQFVREIVRRCGQPIALTSANVSNSRSNLDVEVSHIHIAWMLILDAKLLHTLKCQCSPVVYSYRYQLCYPPCECQI